MAPDPNQQADKQEAGDEFFCALGRVISGWQTIEMHLAYLFSLLVITNKPNSMLPQATFETISNFRDKLKVLDVLVTGTFIQSEAVFAQWPALHRKIHLMSLRRNKIVHALTIGVITDGKTEYLAGPPLSKGMPIIHDDKLRLKMFRNLHQLNQMRFANDLLASKVLNFSSDVQNTLSLRKLHAAQSHSPKKIQIPEVPNDTTPEEPR